MKGDQQCHRKWSTVTGAIEHSLTVILMKKMGGAFTE